MSYTAQELNRKITFRRVTITQNPVTGAEDLVTVLFLHGQSYSSRIWDDRKILDPVAAAGFSVALPGGGTPIFVATADYQACDAPNTALLQASAIDTN